MKLRRPEVVMAEEGKEARSRSGCEPSGGLSYWWA